ncbi:MAG TPA: hypothetical protein VF950_25580 [Planctomycetota bacterium]
MIVLLLVLAQDVPSGKLHVGWASRDITPDRPVALAGQFHKRISTGVAARLSVTALALETRSADGSLEQGILVSCDLVAIRDGIQARLRKLLEGKLEGFDLRKLLLSATHTHTGPVTDDGWYDVTEEGVMKPAEYVDFFLGRAAEAVVDAWSGRKPGGVTWGLGYAVVGLNRRMTYADGKAAMYGRNDRPDFRGVEGGEDHGVESLFFFDGERRLTGVAINVACPSQVVENANTISSDFWDDVRLLLRERHGAALQVLGWCGAAGDQSPHPQLRKAADARMRKLHGGVTETRAIAQRMADAVDYAWRAVKNEVQTDVPFAHRVEDLKLPGRKVTPAEADAARAIVAPLEKKPVEQRTSTDISRLRWHGEVLKRYERPDDYAVYPMELHVLRLGDVAIASNAFELFLDYGVQMRARSRALQTFVIQLACGCGGYLPTERAVAGGGYSAIPESGLVGPEGGRALVDRTVEILNGLWPAKPRK